ncbi:MAG: tetratricopeptide repeat protein [Anaerolineae bacterium]|nr:tetratricopeptide repeat protein [Anaerolineae bacterium]
MMSALRQQGARVALLLLLAMVSIIGAQEATPRPDPCQAFENVEINLGFFIGRGDAYFTQNDLTQAAEAYTCAIELDPDYVPAYVQRGYVSYVQRNDPQALADFDRALELDPNSTAALNNRGMLYLSQGRFQQAIDDFDRVIALAPEDPLGYHNRAVVHASEGSFDFALDDLETALSLDPEYAEAYATRGAIYLAMANADYTEYQTLKGRDANLQTGNPFTMLNGLREDRLIDGFGTWLALLVPAREETP